MYIIRIYIFKTLKFYLYFKDHNPPHVHLFSKNGTAVIEIKSLKITGGKGLSKNELKMGLIIVEENREDFLELWRDLNEK